MSNSCDLMGCSPPGSSVLGILQTRIRSGLPFPSPGYLPKPGIELTSPALAGRFFTTQPPGKLLHSIPVTFYLFCTHIENPLLFHPRSDSCLSSRPSSRLGSFLLVSSMCHLLFHVVSLGGMLLCFLHVSSIQ